MNLLSGAEQLERSGKACKAKLKRYHRLHDWSHRASISRLKTTARVDWFLWMAKQLPPKQNRFPQKNSALQVNHRQARLDRPRPVRPIAIHCPALNRRLHNQLLALALLLGAIGLVGGGAWVGVKLILDPDALIGVNQFLPGWLKIPGAGKRSPQTLSEIQASLRKQGFTPGEVVLLGSGSALNPTGDFLLPVLTKQADCIPNTNPSQPNCLSITELRIYQPIAAQWIGQTVQFQMVSQFSVAGPDESLVLAPLINAKVANLGSDNPRPLTEIRRFSDPAPSNGVWLYLSGQMQQGNATVTYGQVAHYNPKRTYLSLMEQWSSPVQLPYWREVTGKGSLELVVDQTVGLEPQFVIYQIKPDKFPLDPIRLEAISVAQPGLNHPEYPKALLLARNGLWSTAETWLRSLKRRAGKWNAQAQAQLDLIHWHAQATQAQANKAWSSPSQQVLTALIDDRWTQALKVFQASPDNSRDIATFLKTDTARLWNRITVALKVSPAQPDVKAWGALILAVQKGQPAAIAWLRKQPKTTSADIARVNALIARLNAPATDAEVPLSTHTSQILGTARSLSSINAAAWLRPDPKTPLKLEPGQRWYEIQIANFYDGTRWRGPTAADAKLAKPPAIKQLWDRLGLESESQVQILFWLPEGQQEGTIATVRALQSTGNGVKLLVMGDPPPSSVTQLSAATVRGLPRPLALTDAALQWLDPPTQTLLDLTQQYPDRADQILPTIWQALRQAGFTPGAKPPTQDSLAEQAMAEWTIQLLDLTGDSQPEAILTLDAQTLASLGKASSPRSRTLIVTLSGSLLYSEFATPQRTLVAIADPGDGGLPALLVDAPKNYALLRWSSTQQRLE
jgi:hypothetical protein